MQINTLYEITLKISHRSTASGNEIKIELSRFFLPPSRGDLIRKGNSSRVSKGWENLRISYLLDSARFLVRRLGHLLVNPERLEKGYKGTVAHHEEGTGRPGKVSGV